MGNNAYVSVLKSYQKYKGNYYYVPCITLAEDLQWVNKKGQYRKCVVWARFQEMKEKFNDVITFSSNHRVRINDDEKIPEMIKYFTANPPAKVKRGRKPKVEVVEEVINYSIERVASLDASGNLFISKKGKKYGIVDTDGNVMVEHNNLLMDIMSNYENIVKTAMMKKICGGI